MDDIIDISESWSATPKLNLKSSNFGDGIELLMNDKKKDSSSGHGHGSDINIEDLNLLEEELNNLSDNKSDFFNSSSTSFSPSFSQSFSEPVHSVKFASGSLGSDTAGSGSVNKTWDGFDKFNDIPVDPEKVAPTGPQMSKEELLKEKFKYLRKLETLESKGVNLTKKYTMESPLAEMQGEYEMIMEEKQKSNSIKFSGNMLMAVINAVEFLNSKFDPFDIKIDGWSEQVQENLTDYDDVFGELFEKYKSKATMSPELKLLFQLGGSAMMVHMTNTMFKSAMPGMDDILRQNPDLMKQFQTAAVNSMGQSSPGFSGFMGGIMNPGQGSNSNQNSHGTSPNHGPSHGPSHGPPAPMATQENGPNIYSRPGNNSYGSMNMGQMNMGQMNMSQSNFNTARPNANANANANDGINIRENTPAKSSVKRAEMNGPSDISELLSGLKTKTINIQQQQQQQRPSPDSNNNSTISISDMKEMQGDGNNIKRSQRRKKSDKNTLSLDI